MIESNVRTINKILGVAVVASFIISFNCQRLYGGEVMPDRPKRLGFGEFCERVLAYYPKLKQEAATVELAVAKKLQAEAGYLPRIRGFTSMTTSDDQVYVFGTLLKQRAFTQEDFALNRLNNPASRTNYDIGAYGEMPIFDSLQTVYKVKSASHMLKSARYNESFSRMEAVLVAADAYMHAVKVDELISIVETECANSEADIRQAEELKNKGMVLGADFYSAKVGLGTLKGMLNELTAEKRGLKAILNILMGEDPVNPIEIDNPKIGYLKLQKSLREWLDIAYSMRPDLLAIEEKILAAEAELLRERARALPSISAFGDLRENTQNFNTGGGSFSVGLKGSIDLFDPEYFARVKAARASLKMLQSERSAIKDYITKSLSDEYYRLESSINNLKILLDMKDDSYQAVNFTAPMYREGRKSIADLIEMRRLYAATSDGYCSSNMNSKISNVRLLYLSGHLEVEDVVKILQGGE